MSTQFDGKKIYKNMSCGQAEFDIRGNKIHEHMSCGQAIYEIR